MNDTIKWIETRSDKGRSAFPTKGVTAVLQWSLPKGDTTAHEVIVWFDLGGEAQAHTWRFDTEEEAEEAYVKILRRVSNDVMRFSPKADEVVIVK